jgi:hypothetical protein
LDPLLEDITSKLFSRLHDEETSVQDLAFKTLQEIYFSSETGSGAGEREHVDKAFKLKLERKMSLLSAAVFANRGVATLFFEFLEKASERGTKYGSKVDQIVRTLMSQLSALGRGDGGEGSSSDMVRLRWALSFYLKLPLICFTLQLLRRRLTACCLFFLKSANSFPIILLVIFPVYILYLQSCQRTPLIL